MPKIAGVNYYRLKRNRGKKQSKISTDRSVTMRCYNCGFIQQMDIPKNTTFVPDMECGGCGSSHWLWDWDN